MRQLHAIRSGKERGLSTAMNRPPASGACLAHPRIPTKAPVTGIDNHGPVALCRRKIQIE
jgi:hypothetical protein